MMWRSPFKRFLLAKLHVASFAKAVTLKELEKNLHSLVVDLDSSYSQAIERIKMSTEGDKTCLRRAFGTLAWAALSFRQLSTIELEHIVAFSLAQEDNAPHSSLESYIVEGAQLVSRYEGLLIINDENGTVRLARKWLQDSHLI